MQTVQRVVAAVILLAAAFAHAVPLPAYGVSGGVSFNFIAPDPRDNLSNFGDVTLVGRDGSLSASAAGAPAPRLVVHADVFPLLALASPAFGRSAVSLDYFVQVIGPAGGIPVLIDVGGGVNAVATGDAMFLVESRWNLFDNLSRSLAGDDILSGVRVGSFTDSFSRTASVLLNSNQLYRVDMFVDAEGSATVPGGGVAASAFIDPIFRFAPGVDTALYSLDFSPGIGNSRTVGVPEPGSLNLAIVALGALFAGGRMRRRLLA